VNLRSENGGGARERRGSFRKTKREVKSRKRRRGKEKRNLLVIKATSRAAGANTFSPKKGGTVKLKDKEIRSKAKSPSKGNRKKASSGGGTGAKLHTRGEGGRS